MDIQLALQYYCRENKAPYFVGETFDSLRWDSDTLPKPTEAQLQQAWQDYLANQVATEYQRKRVKEYPSFAEQFDLLYHGGIDGWKAAIKAVKDKYPKPGA